MYSSIVEAPGAYLWKLVLKNLNQKALLRCFVWIAVMPLVAVGGVYPIEPT